MPVGDENYFLHFLNKDLLNACDAMNANDTMEWIKVTQYAPDALEEQGVRFVVPDNGKYCHETTWLYKRNCADDQPIK